MSSNSDLRDRADKIIRLMEQRDDIATEIKDRFEDAKNSGYSVTALRKAIKVARMDADKRAKHETEQLDFETYLSELEGGLNKPRLREIAKAGEAKVAAFKEALERRRAAG